MSKISVEPARCARNLALTALLGATIAAGGCAWRSDVNRVHADLAQLKATTAELAARPPAARPIDVDLLGRDVKSLGERVTTTDARLAEMSARLDRMETRVAATETAVNEVGARLDRIAQLVAKLEAATAAPPQPAVAPAPATSPPNQAAGGSPQQMSAEQMYASALATFRAREHGQAVLDFRDFLARYPRHPLAPSALYWIGEAYFVQHDYRQALVEFDKVLVHGLANSRVPDALLRSGMASKALRDPARAEQMWRRVVAEYPTSDAAQKARGFLSGIGGTSPSR